MADILIRIEKPKNCFLCRFFREVQDYDGTFGCCLAAKKEINVDFDDCFFPSLPEGHGKIIDGDALWENMTVEQSEAFQKGLAGTIELFEMLEAATPIVPAEGGSSDA